ncbi:hypothetical protein GCM10028857_03690 [Salinarchaeum chitinilyticum]
MTDRTVSVAHSVADVGEGPLRNLVEQGTGGTLFHRFEWLRAVEAGLAWEPRHVVVLEGAVEHLEPHLDLVAEPADAR